MRTLTKRVRGFVVLALAIIAMLVIAFAVGGLGGALFLAAFLAVLITAALIARPIAKWMEKK